MPANHGEVVIAGIDASGDIVPVTVTAGTIATSATFSGTVTVVGDAASGSAVAGNPVLTGGQDGTNARSFLTDKAGIQIFHLPDMWSQVSNPGTGVQATTSKGASAGVVHVCVGITASLNDVAAGAGVQTVNLRDGASGAGTILWTIVLVTTATTGSFDSIAISGLAIAGTAGNAMTLEFANTNASNQQTVAITGYDHT